MATIYDAAKYMLEIFGPMPRTKVILLCYYAQAWSFVGEEECLLTEEFVAGDLGPDCLEFHEVFGDMEELTAEDIKNGNSDNLSDDQKFSIEYALDNYFQFSARALSLKAKMEDPWRNARAEGAGTVISKRSMDEYYNAVYSSKRRRALGLVTKK